MGKPYLPLRRKFLRPELDIVQLKELCLEYEFVVRVAESEFDLRQANA